MTADLSLLSYLVTAARMHTLSLHDALPILKAALGQFDLLPLQVADLRGPQTVAIGDQDHGRVAMPIAAVLAHAEAAMEMIELKSPAREAGADANVIEGIAEPVSEPGPRRKA